MSSEAVAMAQEPGTRVNGHPEHVTEVFPELVAILRAATDDETTCAAIDALSFAWDDFGLLQLNADSSEVRDALAARLDDPDRDTRAEAVYALARLGDSRALPVVLAALSPNGPQDIGLLLLKSAAELGDPALIPALEDLAHGWAGPGRRAHLGVGRGPCRVPAPDRALTTDAGRRPHERAGNPGLAVPAGAAARLGRAHEATPPAPSGRLRRTIARVPLPDDPEHGRLVTSRARGRRPRTGIVTPPATVRLQLAVHTPFHTEGLFGHLVATAVPGLEEWRDGAYHRSMLLGHGPAVVSLRPAADHVEATLRLTDQRDLADAVARCRWLLDLDADPVTIDAALAADPLLRPAVAARPGFRVPRCVDGTELALRIVVGQQVSTRAARTVTGRLVAAAGTPLPAALLDAAGSVGWTFPTAADVARLDPESLPMPRRRATTLVTLAATLASGDLDLSPGADPVLAVAGLRRLPGIGPWTTASVAMRALGDPDAFLPTDLGIVAAGRLLGLPTTKDLVAHSARWQPWRSYATQVLWGLLDHPINQLPRD